jgi:ABC-type Zn uptake system ZnuABC Zn-binding protein ZnuA
MHFLLVLLSIALVQSPAAAPLRVVTTVAPLTDMAKQVGGEAIALHGLVPEGVNSHTFHPTPGDVRYLAEADVVILNGLYLEIPIEKLARSSGKPTVTILKLGDNTISRDDWVFDASFPEAHGHPNPHLWLNVAHAIRYVTLIRDQFMHLDPTQAATYAKNTERYVHRLTRLDQCITAAVATIPAARRKLLTYHDSWPYFARRYGMTVLGAVQPANFSEPSAREVARLIDQVRQTQVPAVFGSEVFPSRVLEKIAAETGVQYVDALRDDDLPGALGDAQHSYMGMMLGNVTTMLQVLGGDATPFETCTTTLLDTKE